METLNTKPSATLLLTALTLALPLVAGPTAATALETTAREAVMIDFETGASLLDKEAHEPMPPASMSKMMTVYMVFERLRDGRLKMEDTFSVSENAWRRGGAKSGSSTMFLEPGARVSVHDLLMGIIVQSGNDACIVVAEGLAGSEEAFAEEMTVKAAEIGLKNTVFKNATGWPNPEHRTTAHDLAVLAMQTIKNFPQLYEEFYAQKSFTYNGIKQNNRNPLIYKNMGADGLKTGHTSNAGYGLTASAIRGERRLILVVNGLDSMKARSRESERLLDWGFREFANYPMFKAGETVVDAEVWLGQVPHVPLIIQDSVTLTLPRTARKDMKVAVNYQGPIPAPVKEGEKIADLVITAPEREPIVIPLVAGASVERLGFIGRIGAALKHILWGEAG